MDDMVAIVSGNSLGLSLSSFGTLGSSGVFGNALQGRGSQFAYVNAATGNLVLQNRDELLVSRGLDSASVRTYNSQGALLDDNRDNWSMGFYAQGVKQVGNALTRT